MSEAPQYSVTFIHFPPSQVVAQRLADVETTQRVGPQQVPVDTSPAERPAAREDIINQFGWMRESATAALLEMTKLLRKHQGSLEYPRDRAVDVLLAITDPGDHAAIQEARERLDRSDAERSAIPAFEPAAQITEQAPAGAIYLS